MVRGNMCCGIAKEKVVVRVDKNDYETLLQEEEAAPMDFTGKPLRGFLYIFPKNKESLKQWVNLSLRFVKTLPTKVKKR